ncbi:MAG: DNA primase DnaG [Candidatus Diapherotrites archaeon]
MAKTYVNTVKYVIKLKFEIDGIVDKPDIIGAIFGQSEGLLGDEMDLKELQKNGKLGRIEIEHKTAMGRTKGEVLVPSSMDMAETSLLAAGIESVDKVGPSEAKFEIISMEDTRTNKRDEIKTRAQELLKKMMNQSKPDTQMLGDELREKVRASDISSYGPDKLPAGPDIEISKEIIVVEGRADVINMLKNQIKNVIGMNGSNISPTITELSKTKEITLFIDGDRGGILNARKLIQIAKVAYIAKAPDGKEVEELTRKEILQSLKRKLETSEEFGERKPQRNNYSRETSPRENNYPREQSYPRENNYSRENAPQRENSYRDRPSRGPPMRNERPPMGRGPPRNNWDRNERNDRTDDRRTSRTPTPRPMRPRFISVLTKEETETFKPILDELKGSMKAKMLDEKNTVVKEVKVKDLVTELGKTKKKVNAIVFDGVITKRLMAAAEKAETKFVIGAKKGKIEINDKVRATAL